MLQTFRFFNNVGFDQVVKELVFNNYYEYENVEIKHLWVNKSWICTFRNYILYHGICTSCVC